MFMVVVPGADTLTVGKRLRVELDQIIDRRPGPHHCGIAEVWADGRLGMWISGSDAGQTAKGLLELDVLEAVLVGPEPAVRLQVS